MRKSVMIAMAMICNPKLLMADEPTTALDVTIQAQVLELMKELNEQFETSILLITHDLGVVSELAERVVVIYGGQVRSEERRVGKECRMLRQTIKVRNILTMKEESKPG